MTDAGPSGTPQPGLTADRPAMPPIEDAAMNARRQGCLRWGLVGCAGASVAVIIGLLFLMNNAKKLIGFAFDQMGDQIVAACGPDVSPAEKEEFRATLKAFSERANRGGVTTQQVSAFRSKVSSAVADNRVTGEELRALTAFLKDPPR